jgi:hypothetical protein
MSSKIITVYCKNHTQHTYTLCGLNVKAGDISYHCPLKALAITKPIAPSLKFMKLGFVLITECLTFQFQTKLFELL